MNRLGEHDLLEWPTYDVRLPLAQQVTPQPPYSRPAKPKQALQSHPPGLRRTVAETLCWLLGVLVACGLVFIILAALALQADGWWVRVRVPWVKRNAMPESQQDRPSTSVEYVFLLTKSRSYFWDAAAVRVAACESTIERATQGTGMSVAAATAKSRFVDGVDRAAASSARFTRDFKRDAEHGRNRRNGDWLIESFNGLVLDADGLPLCFVVNPAPFKDAHFATFPPKLVEPMLLAGSRPGDLVLDPFGGACTTALVAARLGRDSVSIDLNPDYLAMGRRRIMADCPMFVEVIG